jgi:hypothetical protein
MEVFSDANMYAHACNAQIAIAPPTLIFQVFFADHFSLVPKSKIIIYKNICLVQGSESKPAIPQ